MFEEHAYTSLVVAGTKVKEEPCRKKARNWSGATSRGSGTERT
jgi:hypothetical protein